MRAQIQTKLPTIYSNVSLRSPSSPNFSFFFIIILFFVQIHLLGTFMTNSAPAVKLCSIYTRNTNYMLLIRSCHRLSVTMATFSSHLLHSALYFLALSAASLSDVIVHPRQPRMNPGEDVLQDHQQLRATVTHFTLQPRGSVYELTPTSWSRTYMQHTCICTRTGLSHWWVSSQE